MTRVSVDDEARTVTTVFSDGAELLARPKHDPESKARARALGYTGPDAAWQMTRAHEQIHSLLALAEGKPCSSALWHAAHPDEPMTLEAKREAHREECVVRRCGCVGRRAERGKAGGVRAPKVCSTPSCPHSQPCPDHPKIPWAGSTRRTELPKDWERRRRIILERDQICTLGITCNGLALSTECHHRGDKHDHRIPNLAGVCTNCHKAATQQQAAQARR